MSMKLQFTLALLFNTLFLNNVYAITPDAVNCNQAFDKGDFVQALASSTKALNANNKDRDALICRGRIQGAQNNLKAALEDFKSADELSVDAFDKTVIALLTGHVYKTAQQYDQAIASYKQTITYAQQAKHKGFERICDVAIGDIYFNNKQYDLALENYLQGNKLDSNDNERAESFEKIALAYNKTNKHELALEHGIKAFLMHEKSGSLDQYAQSSIQLGRYYANVQDYLKAERTLNKIIKFAKDQGGAYYEAQGSYVLAQVKAASGDKPSAKTLVEHAKSIAKSTNDQALDEEILQETRDLFK